jgi:16S rRNA (guanine966-N2)-methyltransferase
MSRIISGRYGGLHLRGPRHDVRPTTGKTKEYIFNVLQTFDAARVLDLFAGTGALGIEALSRSADLVRFVDNDHRSLRLIRENLRLTGAAPGAWECVKADALRFIGYDTDSYDLILADPPYKLELPPEFIAACGSRLDPGGIFVLEYTSRRSVGCAGLEIFREKRMGGTTVYMFRKPPA